MSFFDSLRRIKLKKIVATVEKAVSDAKPYAEVAAAAVALGPAAGVAAGGILRGGVTVAAALIKKAESGRAGVTAAIADIKAIGAIASGSEQKTAQVIRSGNQSRPALAGLGGDAGVLLLVALVVVLLLFRRKG